MFLLVFPHHSYGGGGIGGGSTDDGSIGDGSWGSSIGIVEVVVWSSSGSSSGNSSGSSSEEIIEETIVTGYRDPPSPGPGENWLLGAALNEFVLASLHSNIVPPGHGVYGSSGNNKSQKSKSDFEEDCWQSLTDKPDASISSAFGYRRDPITGDRKLHNGFDIAVATGTPLLAARAGTVNRVYKGIPVGQHGGVDNGNYVRLNYVDGTQGVYLHMKDVKVARDQFVSAGQLIGTSNDTGRSDGPHLHYTIYDGQGRSKNALDPTKAHNQCQSGQQSLAHMGGYGRYGL